MSSTALFVIDLQDKVLATLGGPLPLLRRCSFAIESARMLGLPVVFFEQCPDKLGPTHPLIAKQRRPQDPYFPKESFSALSAPHLKNWLQEKDIRHPILIGIETSICIYQTVCEGLRERLDITLLSDCTAASRPADAQDAMCQMRQMNCTVLPSESVFYSLVGSAQHAHFRTFTQKVKEARL